MLEYIYIHFYWLQGVLGVLRVIRVFLFLVVVFLWFLEPETVVLVFSLIF